MTQSAEATGPDPGTGRANWVRLRTLVLLRWMAVAGQLTAIAAAVWYFDIDIRIVPCLLLVGLSVLANLISGFLFARNRRLTEGQALAALMFDSLQLAALLYLTGGLNNPFALLILAPATIAATALEGRATILVCGMTVVLVTGLAWVDTPLQHGDGSEILVSDEFGFGFWLAIVIGVIFLALYARKVSGELHSMSEALLATQMALAREQKLTDLSGVVAAAAHELGTPLATIKLASSELAEELAAMPDLRADAVLIRDQADRCRDILRAMGRRGNDDLHMHSAPLMAVIEEAAEPHRDRGAALHLDAPGCDLQAQPEVARRPEIIHGLRNLIQNAVDFSRGNVWVDLSWTDRVLSVRITDDGPGIPPSIIDRIGDPFVHGRHRSDTPSGQRPQYEGMGLGLFIAKTLLERTGAELVFSAQAESQGGDRGSEGAGGQRSGASVLVRWPRARIEAAARQAHGRNQPIPT